MNLGFAAGPRLNAAGRMDDMSIGIACLLASSEAEAMQKANTLDKLNLSRRETEESMRKEAAELVKQLDVRNTKNTVGYCLHNENWHQGIVGLVAGRVKERVRRPVAALAPADNSQH